MGEKFDTKKQHMIVLPIFWAELDEVAALTSLPVLFFSNSCYSYEMIR